MTTTKTTEQIHAMYEMNNYGEPDISKEKWLRVVDVQKEIEAQLRPYKKINLNPLCDRLLSSLGLLEEEKENPNLDNSDSSVKAITSSSSPKKLYWNSNKRKFVKGR